MLIVATGPLRHWDGQDSQPLEWIHDTMDVGGSAWEPAWFQQAKGLKAGKEAKRLEYGLVGKRLPSMEEPWVSPQYFKENRKREEGGGRPIPPAFRII